MKSGGVSVSDLAGSSPTVGEKPQATFTTKHSILLRSLTDFKVWVGWYYPEWTLEMDGTLGTISDDAVEFTTHSNSEKRHPQLQLRECDTWRPPQLYTFINVPCAFGFGLDGGINRAAI